jgi:serine/threonine protein phosphatase 1
LRAAQPCTAMATRAVILDTSTWHPAPLDTAGETVFAVGDVHGCALQLEALLDAIASLAAGLDAPTRLVYLGDLIDRGPDSLGVLELWARDARAHGVHRVHRLMGNHEMTLLLALGDGPHAAAARELWLGEHMGGTAVLAQLRARTGRPAATLDRALLESALDGHVLAQLDTMAPHLRIGNLLFVHGGLRPRVDVDTWLSRPWTGFREAEWAWIMADFLQWQQGFDGLRVVHGHTPPIRHRELTGEEDPHRFTHDRLGLDGGSSRNGIVTAAQIETGRYRIVRAVGPSAAALGDSTAVSQRRASNSS